MHNQAPFSLHHLLLTHPPVKVKLLFSFISVGLAFKWLCIAQSRYVAIAGFMQKRCQMFSLSGADIREDIGMTPIRDDDNSKEDIADAIDSLSADGETCLNAGVRKGLSVR